MHGIASHLSTDFSGMQPQQASPQHPIFYMYPVESQQGRLCATIYYDRIPLKSQGM